MNTFPGKLLAVALCGAMIYTEWRRGYFAHIPRFIRHRDVLVCVLTLGVSAAIAAVLLLFDPWLQTAAQGLRAPLVEDLIRFGGWLGQGTTLWFILLTIYAMALILRRVAVTAGSVGCVVSAALASVLSSIIKWGIARARPNANLGHLAFFHWSEALRNHARFQSFPSGDTVIVAAVAWYLLYRCHKVPLGVRWILLVVPLATACSRVLLNKHWPSDTVFSIGLALVSAHCVVRYETFSAHQYDS